MQWKGLSIKSFSLIIYTWRTTVQGYWELCIKIPVLYELHHAISRQLSFHFFKKSFYFVNIYSIKRWKKSSIYITKLGIYEFMELIWCLKWKVAGAFFKKSFWILLYWKFCCIFSCPLTVPSYVRPYYTVFTLNINS